MTVREFERIERIRQRLGRAAAHVTVGIGDDAAVVRFGETPTAISVDAAVEDVHFKRAWLSWHDVGYRSHMAAMSDLAAKGATPTAAVVALGLPATFGDDDLDALIDGVAEARDALGHEVVGGNLTGAREVSITTTVFGALPRAPVLRSSGQAGDTLYVTGPIGVAALGLVALQGGRGHEPSLASAVAAWRRPRARFDVAKRMGGRVRAAIDVSDGLIQDLGHLCRASGLGAVVHTDRVPRGPEHREATRILGLDPVTFGLNGGEDYEVLFASSDPAAHELGVAIGVLRADLPAGTVRLEDARGAPVDLPRTGFDHFGRG